MDRVNKIDGTLLRQTRNVMHKQMLAKCIVTPGCKPEATDTSSYRRHQGRGTSGI